MLKLDHWHIELSSICTLKCPRCPRSEVPESLLNRQLTLDFFKNQLGNEIVRDIKKITFCGNDGDPIYCRDLIDICKWLKSVNTNLHIVIITNGSYKSAKWWKDLGNVLDRHDEITWSIDGWDHDSNIKYRVNSDWNSIISGIESFKESNANTYRTWATIGFKFNQDNIDSIEQLARFYNFDLLQITKSTKFGTHYPMVYGINDPLAPTTTKLLASGHRFERDLISLSDRIRPGDAIKKIFFARANDLKSSPYSGICLIGNKGVFLNSLGEFYPCCWTANRYEHNQSWHDLAKSRFNLYQRNFQEIIGDEFWQKEFLEFDNHECQTKCTREKLDDEHHTTEW